MIYFVICIFFYVGNDLIIAFAILIVMVLPNLTCAVAYTYEISHLREYYSLDVEELPKKNKLRIMLYFIGFLIPIFNIILSAALIIPRIMHEEAGLRTLFFGIIIIVTFIVAWIIMNPGDPNFYFIDVFFNPFRDTITYSIIFSLLFLYFIYFYYSVGMWDEEETSLLNRKKSTIEIWIITFVSISILMFYKIIFIAGTIYLILALLILTWIPKKPVETNTSLVIKAIRSVKVLHKNVLDKLKTNRKEAVEDLKKAVTSLNEAKKNSKRIKDKTMINSYIKECDKLLDKIQDLLEN